MSDIYEQRLARAVTELEASGIGRLNYAPPLFRLARAIGLRTRPPHYMSFTRAMLMLGPTFGLVWGAFMWLIQWRSAGMPWQGVALASLLAGVLFGLMMAGYYRWAGGRAGLSKWEDL
jgi:hypothetical protein